MLVCCTRLRLRWLTPRIHKFGRSVKGVVGVQAEEWTSAPLLTCSVIRAYLYPFVPTHAHARTDTMQVVEHEPNFSKFYPLTIFFLVSQFCTLESSLCVSSSDYYLLSPFGSSLIKVVLDPKIRTTECTHQTTSVNRMNSWLITM